MLFAYQWSWYEKLGLRVLSQGPMPKHVGIILDGNRRFARKNHLANVTDGHRMGYDKLTQVIRILIDIGVRELTVYIFSIENFSRGKEEVDAIFDILAEKMRLMLDNIHELHEDGICIEVVGDWTRIPEHLKPTMAKLVFLTRSNALMKLNLAIVYTARNEITVGVSHLVSALSMGDMPLNDLNEEILEETFRLHPTNPVDTLIRTSGESRLSDFLLWQGTDSVLNFTNVTWPEFSIWNMFCAILDYQYGHQQIKEMKASYVAEQRKPQSEESMVMIEKIRRKQWEIIAASCPGDGNKILNSNGAKHGQLTGHKNISAILLN